MHQRQRAEASAEPEQRVEVLRQRGEGEERVQQREACGITRMEQESVRPWERLADEGAEGEEEEEEQGEGEEEGERRRRGCL